MRINKWLAANTDLSRRKADEVIERGRVTINGRTASLGQEVSPSDTVALDSKPLIPNLSPPTPALYMLNKPVGYVCSRDGQGSRTIYELMPAELQHLNPVGRLDKDSSGLLLLTNDGDLLNKLAHPSKNKTKVYEVNLDKKLSEQDLQQISQGIDIGDTRPSRFKVTHKLGNTYRLELSEGRNRQIRRTFAAINYKVITLHRIKFGSYSLSNLKSGEIQSIKSSE